MEPILIIIGLLFIAFIIWFVYKQIEYVLVSVTLFRNMVRKQDDMVKLLIDIRDNTKLYQPNIQDIPDVIKCPHCTTPLKLTSADKQARKFNCPKCKNEISI